MGLRNLNLREIDYWRSIFLGLISTQVPVLHYTPRRRELPSRVLSVPSAWKGMESVLGDVIETFKINKGRCLEFGVEYGYSTAALSCFFEAVIGVDTFLGDKHTLDSRDIFAETSARLANFKNIQLVRSDYRQWTERDHDFYDLIHVDIVHTYIDTFTCGLWSAQHARCVLFHDTQSFPSVKRAVIDVARRTEKLFYNLEESSGLGILVSEGTL
jgi:hypothetical protein